MVPFNPSRTLRLSLKCVALLILLGVGFYSFPPFAHKSVSASLSTYVYWFGWLSLAGAWFWDGWLSALAARIKMQSRIRAAMPSSGSELNGLTAAAVAIKQRQEERALYILENLSSKSPAPDVLKTRRWLAALASASWMERQRPPRPLSSHHRFPQLQALVLSHGLQRLPLRQPALERELTEATSADLDALAQDYISLVDVLVESLCDREQPFAAEAEDLLAFTTGRVFILNTRERYSTWWQGIRPVLLRGGGALIVGVRLLERELYAEGAQLLNSLAREGLLSKEADTIRRAAGFLALLPLWRMTSSDIPRYFSEGYYYMAPEMGVLRFPMAELPEVESCCRRGKILRDSKKTLIEDTLELWESFGDQLAAPLSLLLKRLLEHKGRQCPARLGFWREQWISRKDTFDQYVALLMDGIAAAASGRMGQALKLFRDAARVEPTSSVALVNQVHVLLMLKRHDEARRLTAEICDRFPQDGHAFISLGRFMAAQLEDYDEAEKLFKQAYALTDPQTEALICLGDIKFMQGLYMDAQDYFSYAKQLDPELPGPKLELARVYMETRRFDLAIENLESVVEDGPEEARDLAFYLMYRTYREMGQDRRAFECLDRVPAKFFKEPDVLDDIAGHLESEHQYAKAREFSERAMLLRANGGSNSDDSDALSAF
ncbi:MAG TPA: tetratricopeptide repeat protein [Planctomycetota bacterium]|nr:tetratricopeptide repeat protein [Planctomycetota bacterium]